MPNVNVNESAFNKLESFIAIRDHLAPILAADLAAEASAIAAFDQTHAAHKSAVAECRANEGDDDIRARMQDSATTALEAAQALLAVRERVGQALAAMLDGAKKSAAESQHVFAPRRIIAASLDVARSLMSPELAKRAALGDATAEEWRPFLEALSSHRATCAQLQAEGADRSLAYPVPSRIYFMRLREALLDRGMVLHGSENEDGFPAIQRPHLVVEWSKRIADGPKALPGQIENERANIARELQAISAGCRTHYDISGWLSPATVAERAHLAAAAPPPNAEPPRGWRQLLPGALGDRINDLAGRSGR